MKHIPTLITGLCFAGFCWLAWYSMPASYSEADRQAFNALHEQALNEGDDYITILERAKR